uniref:Uncharacterized protein n=1 Tax=Noccaea caerulescens TaxID=107243 RepID=A0A1J3JA60_NOCCA
MSQQAKRKKATVTTKESPKKKLTPTPLQSTPILSLPYDLLFKAIGHGRVFAKQWLLFLELISHVDITDATV